MKVVVAVMVGMGLVGASVGCSDDGTDTPTPGTLGGAPGSGGVGTGSMPSGGVGTGSTGTGGAPITPITPALVGTTYSLAVGDVVFEVDSATGARVKTLSLLGANLLTGPTVNAQNWGSTFWLSPQSVAGYPQPAAIDVDPYSGQVVGNDIVLTGAPDATFGIAVTKTFAADTSGWITLEYTMTNTSSEPRSFAPWEVSRVARTGYAFFPTGPGGIGAQSNLEGVSAIGTETWFDAASAQSAGVPKLFADGAGGWLAYAVGNALFVKRFVDIPAAQAAPNEAEIELYAGSGYVELEVQGPLTTLAPGASSTFTVEWKVLTLATPLPAALAQVDTAGTVALASQLAAE